MIQVDVKNLEGKDVDKIEALDSMFGVEWNPELVHQAVVTQQANSRNIIAHAKTRAEVRGGGKKPWKQKGTGRARHGSIRSPLWIGGGATHGPLKEKIYAKKINKKMKQGAIFSALSKQFSEGRVLVIDKIPSDLKTKVVVGKIKGVISNKESAMFVFANENKTTQKVVRNIPKITWCGPFSLNIVDILRPKKILIEKGAVAQIASHYKLANKTKK